MNADKSIGVFWLKVVIVVGVYLLECIVISCIYNLSGQNVLIYVHIRLASKSIYLLTVNHDLDQKDYLHQSLVREHADQ